VTEVYEEKEASSDETDDTDCHLVSGDATEVVELTKPIALEKSKKAKKPFELTEARKLAFEKARATRAKNIQDRKEVKEQRDQEIQKLKELKEKKTEKKISKLKQEVASSDSDTSEIIVKKQKSKNKKKKVIYLSEDDSDDKNIIIINKLDKHNHPPLQTPNRPRSRYVLL
jgi:hypothetical protein